MSRYLLDTNILVFAQTGLFSAPYPFPPSPSSLPMISSIPFL